MIPRSFVPAHSRAQPPDETWRLGGASISADRVDGLEAVRQAVYLILSVERRQYPIYSWNYGTELWDLFGQPLSFVKPELERRVKDALSQDTRITGADGFVFEGGRKALRCTFTVRTIFGDFEGEANVRADHV